MNGSETPIYSTPLYPIKRLVCLFKDTPAVNPSLVNTQTTLQVASDLLRLLFDAWYYWICLSGVRFTLLQRTDTLDSQWIAECFHCVMGVLLHWLGFAVLLCGRHGKLKAQGPHAALCNVLFGPHLVGDLNIDILLINQRQKALNNSKDV